MLIRNLVENAVKYADPGGQVDIRYNPQAATLVVFNSCLPIEGWLPERTFEPFYRPDASRNSATGGNGLGLTICKAICVANGWKIEVKQVEGGVRASAALSRAS
jgi:signal transduction histidine kinase